MTVLGVWSCQYRELRPISFGGKAKTPQAGNTTEGSAENQNEEGSGYTAGRGRGRGRDGGGEYEMVRMNDNADRV
jgi:protein SYS1